MQPACSVSDPCAVRVEPVGVYLRERHEPHGIQIRHAFHFSNGIGPCHPFTDDTGAPLGIPTFESIHSDLTHFYSALAIVEFP